MSVLFSRSKVLRLQSKKTSNTSLLLEKRKLGLLIILLLFNLESDHKMVDLDQGNRTNQYCLRKTQLSKRAHIEKTFLTRNQESNRCYGHTRRWSIQRKHRRFHLTTNWVLRMSKATSRSGHPRKRSLSEGELRTRQILKPLRTQGFLIQNSCLTMEVMKVQSLWL